MSGVFLLNLGENTILRSSYFARNGRILKLSWSSRGVEGFQCQISSPLLPQTYRASICPVEALQHSLDAL